MSEHPDHGDLERRLEESWRTNAAAWTRSIREGRIESRQTVTNEAIVEAVVACAVGRVLDVGCGEGWLARALADRGIEVVGFDGSADLVSRAEEGGGGPFQHLSYADFAADPGRVGRGFGAAVCNFSLLSSDIAGVLRGCHTVLSAGGSLVIQTVHPVFACHEPPYRDGWREERFEGIGEGYGTSMPWYFRTFGSWLAELRAAGFEAREAREPVSPDTGQPLSLLLVSTAGETAYGPIDCSLHDRLEELATLRRECSIAYRGADGERRETRGRIVDVFARGGEEFVQLDGAVEVRLDRLQEVDGVLYRGGERC